MKRVRAALVIGLLLTTTSCGVFDSPTQEERMAHHAALKEQCHESGGKYVHMKPKGYVSAGYWCIWDEESN